MAGIRKRLDMRAQNARESKDRILALKQAVKDLSASVASFKAEKIDADGALEDADDVAARQRGKLNQIETDLRDVRRRKEVNLELVHHLTMSKERYDLQSKSISDHIWETYGLLMDAVEEPMPEDADVGSLRETISMLRERLKNIGEVNALAINEYEEEKQRLDLFETQIADLAEAEQKLLSTIDEINTTATELFTNTFNQVRVNFKKVFNTLFEENDYCDLLLDGSVEDPLEQKIQIVANPRGKRPSNIEQLSGGEKTLTAIALLFAIYLVKPSPFCILDEVDAPLDDANVERFSAMIKSFSTDTQFIVITHNKKTMENSEMLYGVTMPEMGVSKLVAVKMD
jgi:chromosome segregation protein